MICQMRATHSFDTSVPGARPCDEDRELRGEEESGSALKALRAQRKMQCQLRGRTAAQMLPRAGHPGPPEGGATSSAHQMLAALSGGEGWPGAERTSPWVEEQGKDSRWREQCVKRPRSRSARFCSANSERTGRHSREAPGEGGREHPQPGSPPARLARAGLVSL